MNKLKVFENRELRKIFGSKRDEVTGEWRKLHKELLYNLYFSSDIVVYLWHCGLTKAMASPF